MINTLSNTLFHLCISLHIFGAISFLLVLIPPPYDHLLLYYLAIVIIVTGKPAEPY